jgi:chromosomal replication initiation ATPase DnaA
VEEFLVAGPNREAVAWLERWPRWPAPALLLSGAPGSGKSHLARIFAARVGGRMARAHDLTGREPADLMGAAAALVLEDLDRALTPALERATLHLFNVAREQGRHLLLTARKPPARWPLSLADLRSRLNACPVASLGAPDDALMTALVAKLFHDRGVRVDEAVIRFLVARIERSCAAAQEIVARLDEASLRRRGRVTVPLVRALLDGAEAAAAPPEPSA